MSEEKFLSIYRGIITRIDDPKKMGRVKALIPSVLGPDTESEWALPCMPFGGSKDEGIYFLPKIQSTGWFMFENGDIHYPVFVGTWWTEGSAPSEILSGDKVVIKTGKNILIKTSGTLDLEDSRGGIDHTH